MNNRFTPASDFPHHCSQCKQTFAVDLSRPGDVKCPHCQHLGWFRVQQVSDPVIIDLLPQRGLEVADIAAVGAAFIGPDEPPHILLNFSSLTFISSIFLVRLTSLHKKVRAANGRIVLCGLNSVIQEIFQVTKLDSYFEFGE